MTVDWNKPIICKENGARLSVQLGPDSNGDRICQPMEPDCWPDKYAGPYYVGNDGRARGSWSYTVINAPEADIPHWAKVRACELTNAEGSVVCWHPKEVSLHPTLRALARLIAQHEPEPVDPDLELAREAVAAEWSAQGDEDAVSKVLQGMCDGNITVCIALRAIKLVRERGQ